jgi:hypothetical protein
VDAWQPLQQRSNALKKLIKPGVVLAGYVVAYLVADEALYLRQLQTQGDPAVQASAGMYAFGDFLLFIEVFGVLAIIPTVLTLYFLRPFHTFWLVFSIGCLALAATGLAATVVVVLAHNLSANRSVWGTLACFGVLRTLIAPVLAPGFMVSALAAPTWPCRWTLFAAAVIEGVAGVSWFLWCCSMAQ